VEAIDQKYYCKITELFSAGLTTKIYKTTLNKIRKELKQPYFDKVEAIQNIFKRLIIKKRTIDDVEKLLVSFQN
jgi:hypothetical protein